MGDGDTLSASQEQIAYKIIENQLRGGILASGGNRVLDEGTYLVQVNSGNFSTVTLTGNPALRGFANEGFVEVYGQLRWENLAPNQEYYLYVRTTTNTYLDPGNVETVTSTSPITLNDHLYLAKIDTADATPSSVPTIDTTPTGKATAFNLFSLLNDNSDPFGSVLNQSILNVLQQFSVRLGKDKTALFQQLNSDATLPVISIENAGDNPEIISSGELRLADVRIPAGFALTDAANEAYLGVAESLIGALNEILATIQDHIEDNTDPHGETLNQTNLVVQELLTVKHLKIEPGSPPSFSSEIESTGELRFKDSRLTFPFSDTENGEYLGSGESLIGALNELLDLITTLSDTVTGLTGATLSAISPVTFEVNPDEAGINLHFKLVFAETENFSPVILTKESKVSNTGWFYEYQNAAPPLPPSPPRDPNELPGEILVPDELPKPIWVQLPTTGLAASLQTHFDTRPTKVQYRFQSGDGIYLRRHYRVLLQQYNTEYGESELASMTFG